jgi:biotin transport system substrate-specific component
VKTSLFTVKTLGSDFSIAFAGSILLAFLSQYSITLPFTPVPISLQTIGVFLLGGLLGPVRGFLSVLLYLIEGTIGLPVFAGGLAKPLWFSASTAGFLFSFLFTVPLIGKMLENKLNKNWLYIFLSLTFAQVVMFIFGMGWLSLSLGLKRAFTLGVAPFLVGAIVKIAVSTLILRGLFSSRSSFNV